MKKIHVHSLKFHTLYSIAILIIFASAIMLLPNLMLGITMLFLVLFIAGNGIIHTRKNELSRDAIIEYIIVSVIVLVVICGLLLRV